MANSSYTPVKLVDVADELYREMGEPSDWSIASISWWLRANIGDLNISINKRFYVDDTTLEITSDPNSGELFTDVEKSIFKMLFSIHFYERLLRNALGAASTDSLIEINQNGFSARKINKNELAKTYRGLANDAREEMERLVTAYNIYQAAPRQVAGEDGSPIYTGSGYFYYPYGYHNSII